ncbi:MAG: DUF7619 domain-containing protein, partial [Thermoanaerobaculia bacterium]
ADFLGASSIGGIGAMSLSSNCRPATIWDGMRFVPSPEPPPPSADVALLKTGPAKIAAEADVQYTLEATAQGTDDAIGVRVADFLPPLLELQNSFPPGRTVPGTLILELGDVPGGTTRSGLINLQALPFYAPSGEPRIDCESTIVNVAIATSDSPERDRSDNLDLSVADFDKSTRRGSPEICYNGIDDNCNGAADCGEELCGCVPMFHAPSTVAGCGEGYVPSAPFPVGGRPLYCAPIQVPAEEHHCTVPRGACGGVRVPAWCCELYSWGAPRTPEEVARLRECNLGVAGCVPVDPNFKEVDPPVNAQGYGYAFADQSLRYTLHYENVGTADAHDVAVIDVLDEDLDLTTLRAETAGYSLDLANRALTWIDPVVSPGEPRSVSFSIRVRADAPPDTRIRNVGTIVFPDADPPSRIDTNFVEHLVIARDNVPEPVLEVLECVPAGGDAWRVRLVNNGFGYAYNVVATIESPPAAVVVLDGEAGFSHPDDPNPSEFATTAGLATTTSEDTVAFTSLAAGDVCRALQWRLTYEDFHGQSFERLVQALPDTDRDAVPDAADNCPAAYNPRQEDGDGDGVGDACDNCTAFPNPRVSPDFLAANPWATLTGGQRDDDHDGYGNLCDAKFAAGVVPAVGTPDLGHFRASLDRHRATDACAGSGTAPCAIFDLDEAGPVIDSNDMARFRELQGRPPGPTCETCPQSCEAGPLGSCD